MTCGGRLAEGQTSAGLSPHKTAVFPGVANQGEEPSSTGSTPVAVSLGLPRLVRRPISTRNRVQLPTGPLYAHSMPVDKRGKAYLRRLAARRATSRTQVTGLASSAAAPASISL